MNVHKRIGRGDGAFGLYRICGIGLHGIHELLHSSALIEVVLVFAVLVQVTVALSSHGYFRTLYTANMVTAEEAPLKYQFLLHSDFLGVISCCKNDLRHMVRQVLGCSNPGQPQRLHAMNVQ